MFSKRAPPREQQFVPLHSAYKILVPETSSQEELLRLAEECSYDRSRKIGSFRVLDYEDILSIYRACR